MIPISGSVSHRLSKTEVRQVIEQFIERFHALNGVVGELRAHWSGDRVRFEITLGGRSSSGEVEVREWSVAYTVNLPWTLALFATRIKQIVEESGRKMLGSRS